MKRNYRSAVAVSAMLLLAPLSACSSSTDSATATDGACKDESSPGVSKNSITLGTTLPLTGSAATTGLNAKLGEQAAVDYVNGKGGVNGRDIKIEFLDDAYDPAKAQANVRELIQQKDAFMIVGGSGTGTILAWAPALSQFKVPAVGPYAGSSNLGTMKTPFLYMLFPHYGDQLATLTKYAVEQNQSKKVAVVSISGDILKDAKAGVDKALEGTSVSVKYFPETPGTTNFAPLATSVKASGADLVVLMMTNGDTAGFLNATRRLGYKPKLAAWPGMADASWIDAYGDISEGMLVANPVANPSSDVDEVVDFASTFEKQTGKKPTLFNEIGWIQAMTAIRAIEEAKHPTRPCVIESLNSFDEVTTGLVPPLTFGKDDRQGSTAVEIDVIHNSKLETVKPFSSSDEG